MDFSLTEEQQAIQELARQILSDRVTQERLKQVEAGEERVDRELWAELARAGLLALAVPAELGGSGLGFLEVCVLLEEVGRTVAPVPALETLVMGALPVAAFGSQALQAELLGPVAGGDSFLTAALVEEGGDPRRPATRATREGEGWRLEGSKAFVPYGTLAQRVVVSAATGEGTAGLFVVDPEGPGVRRQRQETSSGRPEAELELDGAPVPPAWVLGDPTGRADALEWLLDRVVAGLCVVAVGVCEEALRLTAEYTKTREQFDRPIATFQAVGQRAADAYIDTEAVRLTAWQAAWRLSEDLPAAHEVAMAKYWAADGGQRVVHAAQHLHGGIGVDREYPLHRYFLWAKHIELTLGGATPQLLRLGSLMASEPA
jgi:alkylation response protein AidB-like acyl-CoA dehydrogenase